MVVFGFSTFGFNTMKYCVFIIFFVLFIFFEWLCVNIIFNDVFRVLVYVVGVVLKCRSGKYEEDSDDEYFVSRSVSRLDVLVFEEDVW